MRISFSFLTTKELPNRYQCNTALCHVFCLWTDGTMLPRAHARPYIQYVAMTTVRTKQDLTRRVFQTLLPPTISWITTNHHRIVSWSTRRRIPRITLLIAYREPKITVTVYRAPQHRTVDRTTNTVPWTKQHRTPWIFHVTPFLEPNSTVFHSLQFFYYCGLL